MREDSARIGALLSGQAEIIRQIQAYGEARSPRRAITFMRPRRAE